VDGVVLGRSGQAFGDLYDIERLEVLRGPQGTLFGKNASAGVVNIITKGPNTEQVEGSVSVSAFEDSEFQARGRISGPINDQLAASLTVSKSDFAGFIRNEFNGENVNGYDRWGARAQFLWPLTIEHTESDDDCCTDVPALAANNGRFADSLAPPGGDGIVADPDGGRPFADIQLDTRTIDQDFETQTENDFDSIALNIDFEALGGHTITSITSYREWENTEIREGDFTSTGGSLAAPVFGASFLLHDVGTRDNEQFSQEFRIQSPVDSRVNYQFGAYYFELDIDSDFTRDASCQNNSGQNQAILDANPGLTCNANDIVSATNFAQVEFENYAFFGNVDFDVIPGLNLFIGARYTDDEVTFTNTRVNNDEFGRQGVGVRPDLPNSQFPLESGGFAIPNLVPDGLGGFISVPAFSGTTDDTDFAVRTGFNADLGALFGGGANWGNFYFTFAEGYKGPAFNVFFNQGTSDTVPIAPEESDHYEIGYKLSQPNWQLNVAIYHTDITGFQANSFDTSTGVTITRLTNAGQVTTRGVEVDAVWAINEYLSLTGSFAYNDAEIVAFDSPVGFPPELGDSVFAGEDLLFSPDYNYTVGLNFNYPVSNTSEFFLNTTFSRVDDQESLLPSVGGDPVAAASAPFPIPAQSLLPSYNLWDLSLGMEFNEKYKVTLIAKNLLDESFVTTNSGDVFRFQIPREADRYFGVNFRANF